METKYFIFTKHSTLENVKYQYKELAKAYHPDKEGGSDEIMAEINEEYQSLITYFHRKANRPDRMVAKIAKETLVEMAPQIEPLAKTLLENLTAKGIDRLPYIPKEMKPLLKSGAAKIIMDLKIFKK